METYLYKFLKKKCEEKGFVYGRLEDKADLSHSVVQAIRNGRTQLKPATKQKLAQALGCSIGDIQDAIRWSDEVLEDGEVVRKKVYDKPVPEKEPEPHCPYDGPVEEPSADLQDKPWMDEKQPPTELPGSYIKGKIVPAPLPDVPKETPEKKPYTKPEIVALSTKVDSPDCRKCKPVPLPDFQKENPETEEATSIMQTVVDAITMNASSLTGVIKTPAEDKVNHPSHYTQGGIECIEALKASMSTDEFRGYLKGCQMKYMWRYRLKNGVEDLKKARWYLNRLISEMEGLPDE